MDTTSTSRLPLETANSINQGQGHTIVGPRYPLSGRLGHKRCRFGCGGQSFNDYDLARSPVSRSLMRASQDSEPFESSAADPPFRKIHPPLEGKRDRELSFSAP